MSQDNVSVTREVTRAKDICYRAGAIEGVLIPRDDGKRVLHLCLPQDYNTNRSLRKTYDRLVAKAKQRDGVAGVEHHFDRVMKIYPDGEVGLVRS